jgi:hypothetical protein
MRLSSFCQRFAPVDKDDDRAALFPDETGTSTVGSNPEETGSGRRAQDHHQVFLASTRTLKTWRFEGGLTASWVGFGDFPLNPQEKTDFIEKTINNFFESTR